MGDPAAELVCLAFGGDTGPDRDLADGYTQAGGQPRLHARHPARLGFYGFCLTLLLVVECGPRRRSRAPCVLHPYSKKAGL